MSDSRWNPAAQLKAEDGREYAVIVLDYYGVRSVFLCWRDARKEWTRPHFVPIATGLHLVALSALSPGVLRVTFAAHPNDRASVVPIAQDIVVADIAKDTDVDGWTDLEETQLGLNPHSTDSDADGITDDRDATPSFAGAPSKDPDEEQILQRAIFANFGLTGASHALFADKKAPRLQLYGIPGPVIYSDRIQPRVAGGGVQVSWRLLERRDDSAIVEITDYEGPLAASGEHVTLRRIAGEWYVVSRLMRWIS